ncbi:hypothetical protein PIB30_016322 [Stylosanthes scabra]|uniref:RNase H type-1 domain-containing protein n=1 Tax=Stylosanthes scabra TaxID=79078 RepID=A0ABU6R7J9_9FABA|nr:hypothetical protein [Stylosanthes scabra]
MSGLLISIALWWIWRARCQQLFQPEEPWSNLKVDASFGCVLRYGVGSSILGSSGCLTILTIFRCELLAVWNGLMLVWEAGYKNVICETDSLEVFQLLRNIYGFAMLENVDLTCKIKDLLCQNWLVKFAWINREANSITNCLAKKGVQCGIDYLVDFSE